MQTNLLNSMFWPAVLILVGAGCGGGSKPPVAPPVPAAQQAIPPAASPAPGPIQPQPALKPGYDVAAANGSEPSDEDSEPLTADPDQFEINPDQTVTEIA